VRRRRAGAQADWHATIMTAMWNRNLVILLGSQFIAVSGSAHRDDRRPGRREAFGRLIRDVAAVDHGRGTALATVFAAVLWSTAPLLIVLFAALAIFSVRGAKTGQSFTPNR
jgi:hypothetical protein